MVWFRSSPITTRPTRSPREQGRTGRGGRARGPRGSPKGRLSLRVSWTQMPLSPAIHRRSGDALRAPDGRLGCKWPSGMRLPLAGPRSQEAMTRMEKVSPTDGLSLKIVRVARQIRACDVADALHVAPQRISAIEGAIRVTPRIAMRYLEALSRLTSERRTAHRRERNQKRMPVSGRRAVRQARPAP